MSATPLWRRALLYKTAVKAAKALLLPLYFNSQVVGKENLREFSSGIVVANHTHPLDCALIAVPLLPRYLRFTVQEENFAIPVAGKILEGVGCISVRRGSESTVREFNENVGEQIAHGNSVVIYPEGNINLYERTMQQFHDGAFHVAVSLQQPVLPIVSVPVYRTGQGSIRQRIGYFLRRGRLSFRVEILPVMYPPRPTGPSDYLQCVEKFRDSVAEIMQKYLRGLG